MKYILPLLGVIIIILLAIDIVDRLDKINTPIIKFDETPYKNAIDQYESKILILNYKNLRLSQQNDSLENLKQKVKTVYYDKIIYLSGASTDQLENYIRSNW